MNEFHIIRADGNDQSFDFSQCSAKDKMELAKHLAFNALKESGSQAYYMERSNREEVVDGYFLVVDASNPNLGLKKDDKLIAGLSEFIRKLKA